MNSLYFEEPLLNQFVRLHHHSNDTTHFACHTLDVIFRVIFLFGWWLWPNSCRHVDKWNLTATEEIYYLTQMSLSSIPNKGLEHAKRMKRLLADVSPTPIDIVYNEGRKPHADEKQTIASIFPMKTAPEISQHAISLHTIPITTFALDVKICTFNHLNYFLFVTFGQPEYQPPIVTVSAGDRSARPAKLGVHPIWWRWHGNTRSHAILPFGDV